MRVDRDKITILTNANGSLIQVATGPDGKLYIVDSDRQLTRDLLPDNIYSTEGLKPILVKDGRFVQSKFSLKPGIKPMAKKIPFQSINQRMQQHAAERKAEIADMMMRGII